MVHPWLCWLVVWTCQPLLALPMTNRLGASRSVPFVTTSRYGSTSGAGEGRKSPDR